MNHKAITTWIGSLASLMILGCEKPKPASVVDNGASGKPSATVPAPSDGSKAAKPAPAARVKYTAENNPTTKAGRGEPSLDDKDRPAAWVLIDDLEGEFRSEGSVKLLQWFVDGPVSSTPTFRVEAFEPLLGAPNSFQGVLSTSKSEDGSAVVYAIKAADGTFEVGKDYSLNNPGANFTIINKMSGEVVASIPPLAPGQYGFLTGVKLAGSAEAKEALAVTYFTVGK